MGVDRGGGEVTDFETDPRPLAECLHDFALTLNGGTVYGMRPKAARELRISIKTLNTWMEGRNCPYEASMRRLMTEIAAKRKII